MSDLQDIVQNLPIGSDQLRVLPNAIIQIYDTGIANLVAEVQADGYGKWSIETLPMGHYDLKVNGVLAKIFHFVPADHEHQDENWIITFPQMITADVDENVAISQYGSDVAGTITRIKLMIQTCDASGDATIHVLKGSSGGAGALTVSSDSVWNHRVNPGSVVNRYLQVDNNPGITVAANEVITMGIDFSAAGIGGVTLFVVFRPE